MTVHEITVEEMRPTRWRSLCKCGYKSAGYTNPGFAKESGESHVRSITRKKAA